MSFPVNPSAPKYDHCVSTNIVIWCRMALWSGPGAMPGSRNPRLCTWALRWPALGPTLQRPFGASKQRPGRFGVPNGEDAAGGRYYTSEILQKCAPNARHPGPCHCAMLGRALTAVNARYSMDSRGKTVVCHATSAMQVSCIANILVYV